MAQPARFATPAYLVGFTLIAIPVFDALMQVYPFHFGDPRWRFGFLGLMANALMIPSTGLLVIFAVASRFEQRRFQKVMGALCAVLAVGVIAMTVLFALDALQVQGDSAPAAAFAFKVATTTALLKSIIGAVTLAAFAVFGLRAPKSARAAETASRNPIIVPAPSRPA